MSNPIFEKMEGLNLSRVAKALNFKYHCEVLSEWEIETDDQFDGDKQLKEWEPKGPDGYKLAVKFWNENNGMTAFFVKPMTDEAQTFWDFTMQYKDVA